jgi:HSP20 family molecular chaperone IbpA
MIREVGESVGRAVLSGIGRASSRVQERRPLPADLLESDDAYLVVFDAPGARAGDVDVRFEADTLTVRVDRFRDLHEDYEMRFPGRGLSLSGSVTLPESADVEAGGADATLAQDGTLEVLIPKRDHGSETAHPSDHTSGGTDADAGETHDEGMAVDDETADDATDETPAGTDETTGESDEVTGGDGEATNGDSGETDGGDETGEVTGGDGEETDGNGGKTDGDGGEGKATDGDG